MSETKSSLLTCSAGGKTGSERVRSGSKPPANLWPRWSWSRGFHLQHHSSQGSMQPWVVSCRSGPACPSLDHPYQSPSGPIWVGSGCTVTQRNHHRSSCSRETWAYPHACDRRPCGEDGLLPQRRPVLSGPIPQSGPPSASAFHWPKYYQAWDGHLLLRRGSVKECETLSLGRGVGHALPSMGSAELHSLRGQRWGRQHPGS